MITREEVENFLKKFHNKFKIYDIIFRDDRGKNTQALAELDITPNYRLKVIETITVEDYSEGPIINTLNKCGDLWKDCLGDGEQQNHLYIIS